MILLVSYDLRSPGQNYQQLYDELKKARSWWHYLDSTWLIRTELKPEDWNRKLLKYIDQNDSLLIIQVSNNYQGYLPEKAWQWIKKHFDEENIEFQKIMNKILNKDK